MRAFITIAFYLSIALVAALVIGDWIGANRALQRNKLEYVTATCDIAHSQYNGATEQACADAQNRTGYEYLCNNDNSVCWTEAK